MRYCPSCSFDLSSVMVKSNSVEPVEKPRPKSKKSNDSEEDEVINEVVKRISKKKQAKKEKEAEAPVVKPRKQYKPKKVVPSDSEPSDVDEEVESAPAAAPQSQVPPPQEYKPLFGNIF